MEQKQTPRSGTSAEAHDDGGPAFPVQGYGRGLTLRDYFAAKAMHAVLNSATAAGAAVEPEDAAPLAKAAYFVADAMLAARGGAQ